MKQISDAYQQVNQIIKCDTVQGLDIVNDMQDKYKGQEGILDLIIDEIIDVNTRINKKYNKNVRKMSK